MSFITRWAFRNKAAVGLVTALTLLLGLASYFTLPMEFLPVADEPRVMVVVMGQGTDSRTMESQVTTPIESAVSGVKGKSTIFSVTGDGYSKVDVMFESGTDMKEAKQEVQDLVSSLPLPANVSKPNVVQLNTSMIPIADIAITFEGGLTAENLEFASQNILPRFKALKGIGNIQTFGKDNSYVSIKVDNRLLAEKQIPLPAVLGVLQGKNLSTAISEKTIDGKTSNIKVSGSVDGISDLENLPLAPGVLLKDIASIDTKKAEGALMRVKGEEGLLLIVTKESSANAVSITKELRDTAREINKDYPDVNAEVVIATADMVKSSVNSMMKEVLLGAFFATIVIMVFLRNIRSTFITVISIPLSLALTLFLLARSGVTLNILTLGGVAVAVGRLVDDSIVVIENIFRKMQKEKFSVDLILQATKEVGPAITSSTLTTVAVFLPIGLVNGGLQDFLLPFALTLTYALLTSLLVALTLVPVMSAGLLKHSKLHEHKPSKRFIGFLTWSLNHKWVIILMSFLLFAGSVGTYAVMPKGAIDNSAKDFVSVFLNYPNDTPLDEVKENTLKLEEYVLGLSEVKNVFTQLGNSEEQAKFGEVRSPTAGSLIVIPNRKEDMNAIVKKIEKQKATFTESVLSVEAVSLMGGSGTQVTIDVVGENMAEIEKAATDIKEEIQGIEHVETVSTNQEAKKIVYNLEVDPAKANAGELAGQLAAMLNRTPAGTITLDEKETAVFIEPLVDPKSSGDLMSIPVMTSAGPALASDIASLKESEEATSRFHKDGDAYIRVSATVNPKNLSEAAAAINKAVLGGSSEKGLDLPDDVEVFIGGANAQQMDDFTDLYITMAVSIGLVFLIMVITFKSLRAPIAILFSLPLAAIGAILGLLISRISVDITALLGALMLIGIVVTNAIVLLDRVKQNEEKMILRDALIEAAAIRMRPILMTAVATISAMVPLLYKEAETGNLVSQSLAVVVIGGLAVATLLTLVVIPVIYELLHFRKSKKQRIEQNHSSSSVPM